MTHSSCFLSRHGFHHSFKLETGHSTLASLARPGAAPAPAPAPAPGPGTGTSTSLPRYQLRELIQSFLMFADVSLWSCEVSVTKTTFMSTCPHVHIISVCLSILMSVTWLLMSCGQRHHLKLQSRYDRQLVYSADETNTIEQLFRLKYKKKVC